MGRFNIPAMLIGMLLGFGLFITIVVSSISLLGNTYGINYDESDLDDYSHLNSLSSRIEERTRSVDEDVYVNTNLFDYLAGIFNKVLAPFKFIYRSYSTMFSVTGQAVADLQLMDDFQVFIEAVILVLVVVGIVMFRIYMKVNQ